MIKKYLDSNLFLFGILYEDKSAKDIMQQVITKEFIAITSVLTWDEVVYTLKKLLGKEIALYEGRKLLNFPHLQFIDADKRIVSNAQSLIEKYNINPRDAIHAATAIINNANEIISDDRDFDIITEIKRTKIK